MPREKRLTQAFPASKGGSRLSGDAKKRKVDTDATKTLIKKRRLTEADKLAITAGVGSNWNREGRAVDDVTKDAKKEAKRRNASSQRVAKGESADCKTGKGKQAKKGNGLKAVSPKRASKKKTLEKENKKPGRKPKKVAVALKISRKGRKAGKVAKASEKEVPEEEEAAPATTEVEEEEGEASKEVVAPSKRAYLEEASYDGETFKVGDSAYVVMDPDAFDWEAEEEEVCQVCGSAEGDTLLECDRCLLGYHLKCLKPPLKDVPKVLLESYEEKHTLLYSFYLLAPAAPSSVSVCLCLSLSLSVSVSVSVCLSVCLSLSLPPSPPTLPLSQPPLRVPP